jgi:hypothetical protein
MLRTAAAPMARVGGWAFDDRTLMQATMASSGRFERDSSFLRTALCQLSGPSWMMKRRGMARILEGGAIPSAGQLSSSRLFYAESIQLRESRDCTYLGHRNLVLVLVVVDFGHMSTSRPISMVIVLLGA